MGYIRNQAMIVSGWSAKHVLRAHSAAISVFDEHGLCRLVSGLTQHAANGGAAFFISPDGSKEGWEPSNNGDKARAQFIEWLRGKEACDLYLDWCEILLGGDDGEYCVSQSPNTEVAELAK